MPRTGRYECTRLYHTEAIAKGHTRRLERNYDRRAGRSSDTGSPGKWSSGSGSRRYLGTPCGSVGPVMGFGERHRSPTTQRQGGRSHRNPTDETAHSGTLVMRVKGAENSGQRRRRARAALLEPFQVSTFGMIELLLNGRSATQFCRSTSATPRNVTITGQPASRPASRPAVWSQPEYAMRVLSTDSLRAVIGTPDNRGLT